MESIPDDIPGEIDIVALAFRYLDRQLPDAQRTILHEHLRRDPHARMTFVRCLLQGAELEEFLAAENESNSLQALDGAAAPLVGTRLIDRMFTNDQGRINAPRILVMIAAAMVLGAGLGIWVVRDFGGMSGNSSVLAARDEHDDSQSEITPMSTAVLVKATNCRWDRTRSTADLAGGGLKPGQSLHLLEGVAEIHSTLPSGSVGRFHLEGPSVMTLSDDGMPNLLFGKLSGEFSIRRDSIRMGTPLGQVVITGDSSLGITASADEVELHAFSGAATLDPWSTSPTSNTDQLTKVDTGTSLRVRMDATGKVSLDRGTASENQFVTPASLAASQLVISDQYVSMIRESRPVAYWRFEEQTSGLVRNVMADRFHLRMAGNAVRLRSGQATSCAEFGISAGPGYMMTDDDFDGVIKEDYTIELWAKPTCFHHGALFSLIDWWPDVSPKGRHKVYLEFCGPRYWDYETPGGVWESDPGRLRFINCRAEPYSSEPYVVRKWQHLVALRERSSMRLYADGRLVLTDKNSEELGGGMRVLMGQLYPPTRFIRDDLTARLYSGELDEVALYDRALSEAEIRKHLELVKPERSPEPNDSI